MSNKDITKELNTIRTASSNLPKKDDFTNKHGGFLGIGAHYKAEQYVKDNKTAIANARHLATALAEHNKAATAKKGKILSASAALDKRVRQEDDTALSVDGANKDLSQKVYGQVPIIDNINTAAHSQYPSSAARKKLYQQAVALNKKVQSDIAAQADLTDHQISLVSPKAKTKDGKPILPALQKDQSRLLKMSNQVDSRLEADFAPVAGYGENGLDLNSHAAKSARKSYHRYDPLKVGGNWLDTTQQDLNTSLFQDQLDNLKAKYPGLAKLHNQLSKLSEKSNSDPIVLKSLKKARDQLNRSPAYGRATFDAEGKLDTMIKKLDKEIDTTIPNKKANLRSKIDKLLGDTYANGGSRSSKDSNAYYNLSYITDAYNLKW